MRRRRHFGFQDGCGEVGLISSVTQPFCGTCDRLRLTADGALRNCLFSDREISVREMLRRGAGDEECGPSPRARLSGRSSLVTGSMSLGFFNRHDPCR